MEPRTLKVCAASVDPAIDLIAMGKTRVEKYMLDRDNDELIIKAAHTPQWFYVRDIPTSLWCEHVTRGVSASEQYMRAFQVGVHAVENIVTRDGKKLHGTYRPDSKVDGHPVWTKEELDKLFVGQQVEEIGHVAWLRGRLPFDFELAYPPPQSSLDVLRARVSRSADDLLAYVRNLNSRLNQLPDPSSESAGDEPTSVPATVPRTESLDGSTTKRSSAG